MLTTNGKKEVTMPSGKILVVDNATRSTDNTPFLKKLLKVLREKGWSEITQVNNAKDIDFSQTYVAAILTGSPMLLTEPLLMDCVAANTAVLLQLECPVLGICFGMQMMVTAYGGSLKRLDSFQSGPRKLVLSSDSVIGKGRKSYCVIEAYEDSVDTVPHGFSVVGIDQMNHSSIKAIERVGPPYRAGVLFHPEGGRSGLCVLHNFLDYVDKHNAH